MRKNLKEVQAYEYDDEEVNEEEKKQSNNESD